MSHNVSDSEWTLIKLLERGIWPMFAAVLIGGFGVYITLEKAVAQIQTEQKADKESRASIQITVGKLAAKQEAILMSQHETELTVERIETNQRHLKEDVQEILILLRGNGNGNGNSH